MFDLSSLLSYSSKDSDLQNRVFSYRYICGSLNSTCKPSDDLQKNSNDLLALVRIGRANVGSDMVDGETDVKTLVGAWLSHESSGTWPMIADLPKLMRRLEFLGGVYNKNEL